MCELRWSKGKTVESQLTKAKRKQIGRVKWEENFHTAAEMLRQSMLPDSIVVGGGEARRLQQLPDDIRRVDNDMALEGGEALWMEPRFRV
ncbi:MAG: hypothetical protein H7A49_09735 [Akkermansiaceae bacterium]|nr:hypothetical protein [Akkermansiaceae bacterium]